MMRKKTDTFLGKNVLDRRLLAVYRCVEVVEVGILNTLKKLFIQSSRRFTSTARPVGKGIR